VVDDDELILRTLRRTLRKLGFDTLTASGGEEALRLYKEHGQRIRLVLLDVIMPGMSGQQTFKALKELDPKVKVLISSGYTEEKVAKDLLADGALDFLKKPYELERLKFSIVKALLGAV
jgi:DNA-binding NtrC family response regulator